MTGSVIDGEDVVQDAMIKALDAFPRSEGIANIEAWCFALRIIARWTFCASGRGSKPGSRRRQWRKWPIQVSMPSIAWPLRRA
jgi:DNA-directed RNA polymerase specialized sigma24 family protein